MSRSRWDTERIRSGVALIERAASARRPGPFQVEAAIAAVHDEAPCWEATDWPQLLGLYSLLETMDPSPIVKLNRSLVVAEMSGAAEGLRRLDRLADVLDRYYLFHAARAELLRRVGRDGEARDADARALARTQNPAERALIERRMRS